MTVFSSHWRRNAGDTVNRSVGRCEQVRALPWRHVNKHSGDSGAVTHCFQYAQATYRVQTDRLLFSAQGVAMARARRSANDGTHW